MGIFHTFQIFQIFSFTPLRGGGELWYTTHSFAPEGRASFFENRELEIKENYNSYDEIGW